MRKGKNQTSNKFIHDLIPLSLNLHQIILISSLFSISEYIVWKNIVDTFSTVPIQFEILLQDESLFFYFYLSHRERCFYFIQFMLYSHVTLFIEINFKWVKIHFYRWELYLERSECAAWKRTISYHVYFYTFLPQ